LAYANPADRDLHYEGAQPYGQHELSMTGQTFLGFPPPWNLTLSSCVKN